MKKLFNYDHWANHRMIDAMRQLPAPDERCLQLLSHIFAAQEIWHDRILGKMPQILPFTTRNFDECITAFNKTTNDWNAYLNTLDEGEMNRVVVYKNTKGDSFNTSVQDILTHVINHSTYHRGQIVSTLKGKIEKLPVTDYIAFVRE